MEKQIKMPRLRPEMKNGVLCAWLKEEGETVTPGDPIFEIETDKVVNQIEATESGILKKQLFDRKRGCACRPAGCGVNRPMEKKPEWLKVRYNQEAVNEVAELMRDLNLNTVCKEANCPNLGECYRKHTSTFMILGNVCTRNCRFCNVTTGRPLPPDPEEPVHVAEAAKKLGLRHVVLTCPTRDDLPDGGVCCNRSRDPPALSGNNDRNSHIRYADEYGGY